MRAKALEYAKKLNIENFGASEGLIDKVLTCNKLVGIIMHGDARDMSNQKHRELMTEQILTKFSRHST